MEKLTLSIWFALSWVSLSHQLCDDVPRGTFANYGPISGIVEPDTISMDLNIGQVVSYLHYGCQLLTDASKLLQEWQGLHDGYEKLPPKVLKEVRSSLTNILLTQITQCEQKEKQLHRYVALWDARSNISQHALFGRPNVTTLRLGRSLPDSPYFSSVQEIRKITHYLQTSSIIDVFSPIPTFSHFQTPPVLNRTVRTPLQVSMKATRLSLPSTTANSSSLKDAQTNIARATLSAVSGLLSDHLTNLTLYLESQNRRPKRWAGFAAKAVGKLLIKTFPAALRFAARSSGKRLVKKTLKIATHADVSSPFPAHLAWLHLTGFRLKSHDDVDKEARAGYYRFVWYIVKIGEAISLSSSCHESFQPILLGLESLRRNRLHPLLLPQDDLESALKDLYHSSLLEDRTPLMRDATSLFNAQTESIYNKNTMILTIRIFIPMSRSGTQATLYKWNPLPLTSGSISLSAVPKHQMLAVRKTDRSSFSLDSNELALCRYDGDIHYCPSNHLRMDQAQDRCLQGLYRSNVELVKKHCRFVHNKDQIQAIQISDDLFTIYSQTEMPGRILCPGAQDQPLSIFGHATVQLAENCRFLSDPVTAFSALGRNGYKKNSSPRRLCQVQELLQQYSRDFQILLDLKVGPFGPQGQGLLLAEVAALAAEIRTQTGLRITCYALAGIVVVLILLSGTLSVGLKQLLIRAWYLHDLASHTFQTASEVFQNPSRRNSDTSSTFRPSKPVYPDLSDQKSRNPASRKLSKINKSTPNLTALARSLSRASLAPRHPEEKLNELKGILSKTLSEENIPLKGVQFND